MKYKIQIIGDGGEILQQAWLSSQGGSHDLGNGVFDKGTSELLVGWSFLPDVRSIPRAGEAIRAPFHLGKKAIASLPFSLYEPN